MGTDELARLVRDETPGIGLQRAALIARTEMHNAAQAANMQAAEATGIQGLKKEWLAAEDKRTRPDHNDADGQVVEKEGQFTVGASQMDRPGDQSAPPRQTVNCRCALSFITPEES